ncbi:MAG TPA: hypothetical protein VG348_07380, partial [Acidimicrobiia bacterium]|nr:hypothetical protein [Acidimicrobiia bacterium]
MTFPGLVVLGLGLVVLGLVPVVTGAAVTVGGVELAGAAVTVDGVVPAGGAVPTVPRGTVIAGGGAVVGPAGGSGGTGIVCGATVVTVVAGRKVGDAGTRWSDRLDDPDPQAAKTAAPVSTTAPTAVATKANLREVTGEVCPTECAAGRRAGSGECEVGRDHAKWSSNHRSTRWPEIRPTGVSF